MVFGEEFMISWNNMFPKDRAYRKKYNIAFGSEKHREVNQIDVFLDALEDTLYDKHIESYKIEKEGLETYQKTGNWLKERELEGKKFDELFDAIDVESFNKKKDG